MQSKNPMKSIFCLLFLTLIAPAYALDLDSIKLLNVTIVKGADGERYAVIGSHGGIDLIDKNLLQTLLQNLAVEVDGEKLKVVSSSQIKIAEIEKVNMNIKLFGQTIGGPEGRLLNNVDLRNISLHGSKFADLWNTKVPNNKSSGLIKTDLHTHYGGAIGFESLLKVALKHEIPYPISLLKELGIQIPAQLISSDGRTIKFSKSLLQSQEWKSSDGMKKFKKAVSIDATEITNLVGMEEKYKFRGPFVKYLPAFADFLKALGGEYAKMGVEYAEISVSDVMKPEYLAEAYKVIPQIEAETGVKIRFLAALWRHSPTEFNMDMLRRLQALKNSPLIVGIDIMGHETNSTRAFSDVLEEAVKVGKEIHPLFQIRVHGGENPLYPENVRTIIEIAEKTGGRFRVGHGIYGDLDNDMLRKAAKLGVVIEGNPISNQALNNGLDMKNLAQTYQRYLLGQVPFVLATDGHGLYGGSPQELYTGLRGSGFSDSDIQQIVEFEDNYIKKMEAVYKDKASQPAAWNLPTEQEMPVAKFTNEKWGELNSKRNSLLNSIKTWFQKNGAHVHPDKASILSTFQGRIPILISITSKRGWPEIPTQIQQQIFHEFSELGRLLDFEKVFFISGGTKYDGEETVMRNNKAFGHRILGTYVTDNERILDELGTVTDAVWAGERWHDKSPFVLQMVKDMKGITIFVGGRNVMQDEIIAAKNIGVPFLLRSGMPGASDAYARIMPDRAYSDEREIIALLYEMHPSIFRAGEPTKIARAYYEDVQARRGVKTKEVTVSPRTAQETIAQIRRDWPGKKIFIFEGYSANGYQEPELMRRMGADILAKLDPKEWVICIGNTPEGIGELYQVAKAKGFSTIGIGSSRFGSRASIYVDKVYLVQDTQSGGYIEGTNKLSATSEVIVNIADAATGIGGGKVTQIELGEMLKLGKSVQFFQAEMNHRMAEIQAQKKGKPTPTAEELKGIASIPGLGRPLKCSAILPN